jgi:hypothetical protein
MSESKIEKDTMSLVEKASQFSFMKDPLLSNELINMAAPVAGAEECYSSEDNHLAYLQKDLAGFVLSSKELLKLGWKQVGPDENFIRIVNRAARDAQGDKLPYVGVFFATTTFCISRPRPDEPPIFVPCPRQAWDARYQNNDEEINGSYVGWRLHTFGSVKSNRYNDVEHLAVASPDSMALFMNAGLKSENVPTFSKDFAFRKVQYRGTKVDRSLEAAFYLNLSGMTAEELNNSNPEAFRKWRQDVAQELLDAGAPLNKNCAMFISGLAQTAYAVNDDNFTDEDGSPLNKTLIVVCPSAWKPYFMPLHPPGGGNRLKMAELKHLTIGAKESAAQRLLEQKKQDAENPEVKTGAIENVNPSDSAESPDAVALSQFSDF